MTNKKKNKWDDPTIPKIDIIRANLFLKNRKHEIRTQKNEHGIEFTILEADLGDKDTEESHSFITYKKAWDKNPESALFQFRNIIAKDFQKKRLKRIRKEKKLDWLPKVSKKELDSYRG
tara:strand:+ start:31 stop:387 length:357 start_codon:yes stop_codon:yes gene_type:complete